MNMRHDYFGANEEPYEGSTAGMPKGNDTPTPVIWTEDIVYDYFLDKIIMNHMATCPTREGYPLYGQNPCPYCGQALIVEYPKGKEPKPPKTEISGAVPDGDGGYQCEKCGGKEMIPFAHIDADTWFGTDYKCAKCGAKAISRTKRRKTGQYIF